VGARCAGASVLAGVDGTDSLCLQPAKSAEIYIALSYHREFEAGGQTRKPEKLFREGTSMRA